MARKKIVRTEETLLDEPEQAQPEQEETEIERVPSPEELEQMDAVDYLLSLGGEDSSRYRVDKMATKPGERIAFCNSYSKDALSLDTIREQFGGGTYKITAYGAGSRYMGSRTVTIADLPKPAQPQGVAGQDLAALVRELRGSNQDDGRAMMLEMMRQNAELLRAIITRPEPKQPAAPSTLEILQMIREMNSLQPKSNDASAVELLLKGIDLGKEFAGGGGDDGGIMGLAGKGIEMLKPLIEREAATPKPAPAAPPSAGALPAATPTQPTQPGTADPMLRQLNWLRMQTVALCQKASAGKDPGLYAEVLLDNLPSFIDPADLKARLSDPAAVDQLAQLVPQVAHYRGWFERFRQSCVEFLSDDDQGGEAPMMPDAGDGGDV